VTLVKVGIRHGIITSLEFMMDNADLLLENQDNDNLVPHERI
jgi:hypothetical protein